MSALPPDERRILELRYFESRSSTEIGRILGKSPGSVRSSLFYALRRLETLCRSEADR
jgi:RNA polymerase sigma factor (sigma-70 family)